MKYESQLVEAKKILTEASEILIALPAEPNMDELAAGLALFLSLEQSGKKATIVTTGTIRVGHTHLFGVDKIQDKLPDTQGGNLIITLGGVVDSKGTVPALQKLDWYPGGSDLNLVFHTTPGQKFEPSAITPRYEGGGFGAIFTIGALNLEALGTVYTSYKETFSKSKVINIDNKQGNTNFGTVNVIDPQVSSLSEMLLDVLQVLGLPYGDDIATNFVSGIFHRTNNLQDNNVSADTYNAVAIALRAGGKKPVTETEAAKIDVDFNTPAQPKTETVAPIKQEETGMASTAAALGSALGHGFDLSQIAKSTPNIQGDSFPVPPVVNTSPTQTAPTDSANTTSAEEAPVGEEVVTPEDDWLTPKIFKGSSLG